MVCNFGEHDFVYTTCIRTLARLIDPSSARPAPCAHRWGVCVSKHMQNQLQTIRIGPQFRPESLKGTGLKLLYKTAGVYYNGMDALEELQGIPNRSGKRSVVVTSDCEESTIDNDDPMSEDTEYDSDGQPMPKKLKPKRKAKPKRRKVKKEPLPKNVQYRKEVVEKQENDTTRVFTVNHLGKEICTVLAQLFRGEQTGGDIRKAFAHFYTDEHWLTSVALQATDVENDAIAAVACEIMAQKERKDPMQV